MNRQQQPNFFDVHTHVNFQAFEQDAEKVIDEAFAAKTWMINVGTQHATSHRALDLAQKYDEGVWASVGLHPTHVEKNYFNEQAFRKLAKEPKVVAIGETGLDYFRLEKNSHKLQEIIFRKHIDIALETQKPLMVHCRDAYEDLYAILKEYQGKLRGIIHCYVGTPEMGKKFLELGFFLSFTGIITFRKNNDPLIEAVKMTPLDRFTLETDAPYLAPVPHRGKRNLPVYVRHVAERFADIKGVTLEEIAQASVQNACAMFIGKKV
ncbi:MAG: hypothetical protein A3B74_04380 [Candidatus Kerfeldbacteria bacterium RIFCSPHIGHO2_02_FULL_42_14]|uniref:Hydrolase TatD n=1 Tax=Candidatus Kerfeldbacteria bacterium RIFCSPHIGHO2_02_FULL_42_14 TaxID=1798540 RepID=A0A1G2ARD6_9BACT|nr:MAG: hypothetical protein A3B74_04380 [Candidatus Kerfeldbacteria bacterium RIFCSPHIGHO2_02_FULL_42_14]OGY80827.1 MAG: hypothetical protein A3E60_01440 [Candidatus Kerfeldbacteria bacterium RIFCSPHIGHO2_12_FULL_42_13]OGY84999.1 MAG: hypothetical protein A3I91_00775 [Candidatus Kerfeldbacteria bacterium RIFCSPLOWO2_02_FULL_42_19]OGY86911.1 MAG: hypothetical protein A3G01_04510 [Candidatus Kerfeldbacteria bacterium RIFCSPLOWO2_12_FULL_43_9]